MAVACSQNNRPISFSGSLRDWAWIDLPSPSVNSAHASRSAAAMSGATAASPDSARTHHAFFSASDIACPWGMFPSHAPGHKSASAIAFAMRSTISTVISQTPLFPVYYASSSPSISGCGCLMSVRSMRAQSGQSCAASSSVRRRNVWTVPFCMMTRMGGIKTLSLPAFCRRAPCSYAVPRAGVCWASSN